MCPSERAFVSVGDRVLSVPVRVFVSIGDRVLSVPVSVCVCW